MQKLKFLTKSFLIIIGLLVLSISFLNAQQLFSVSQNNLTKENVWLLINQIAKAEIANLSFTKDNENRDVYQFQYSSHQNSQIIILNEYTENSVIITPIDETLSEFLLAPFFIEELKQGVLGDANHYLVLEVNSDLLVKNVASVSVSHDDIYIPRYFYGKKENVKEAFPQDRQIIKIFKAKPRLISAFPDDPNHQLYIAQLEEELSYYIYMYKLPDGTLCIHDVHFTPKSEKSNRTGGNFLVFDLSGVLNETQRYVTEYALELWSEQLAGTVPIDMWVEFRSLASGVLGASYITENFFDYETDTWYPSTLWNQLVGYDVTSDDDISIVMSSNFNFYFGLDGKTSGYDYVTIMLHEVTHALGFFSICDAETGYYWFDGYNPGIYDRMLYEGTTGPCLTTLTPQQRATLIISNNMYAAGPNLLQANENSRVKIFAPTTYRPGSSLSHWDQTVNNFTTFMKYAYTSPLHTFNTRKIGLLTDLGWKTPQTDPNAVWITFNANDGEGNRPPQPFSPGVTQNLKTNTFTKPGYAFTKWNTLHSGTGIVYSDRESVTISEDLELYAQWQAKVYTLFFDANGGTVNLKNKQITYDTPMGELPIPEREGYEFVEWVIDSNPISEETIWKFVNDKITMAFWKKLNDIEENNTHTTMLIIPNPAKNEIEVRFENYNLNEIQGHLNQIEFYNISGQLVKTIPTTGGDSQKIDISDLSNGLYLVKTGGMTAKLVVK